MEIVKVYKCPECGGSMLFSFALPYKEYVCVPCGTGEAFCNGCEIKEIPLQEHEKLKAKYKKDLQKVSLNTAKNGGGICKTCIKEFNCEHCQEIDKHQFEYWGKGLKSTVMEQKGGK